MSGLAAPSGAPNPAAKSFLDSQSHIFVDDFSK
ncbi:hypothetical protein X728_24525 [Mesorhizobium sp. L103C120A0]|nr:hypothetical protein X728_24525 [Mesorhizobium sp. L103C120A0]